MKMSIKTILVVLIMSALVIGPMMGIAAANVPGVAINAPPPPPAPNVPVQGGTGMVKVVVSHRDTMVPATHYIDHVYLFDGNNMLKEWKYTEKDANTNEVYTESVMMPATKDMDLKAIAHCTLHGYNLNGVYVTVLPAGTKPADMVTMNANIAGMQVNGMDPNTAASTATQMVQQDAQLLKQIMSKPDEMSMLQKHQMMTTQFFQSPQGQKFLDAFDYTKKAGAAAGQQGMMQPGMQPGMAAQGQMMPGQQGMAAQGQQGMQGMAAGQQGQRVNMQRDMSDMRTGANVQAGQQAGMAAPGQMMPGQQGAMARQPMQGQIMPGMAAGIMEGPKGQGIPQTMWTDSMGNQIDAQQAKQLGQAAASMQQGQMMPGQQGMVPGQMGQRQMGQGQMISGQPGMQGMAAGQSPQGQMMAQGQAGQAQAR